MHHCMASYDVAYFLRKVENVFSLIYDVTPSSIQPTRIMTLPILRNIFLYSTQVHRSTSHFDVAFLCCRPREQVYLACRRANDIA